MGIQSLILEILKIEEEVSKKTNPLWCNQFSPVLTHWTSKRNKLHVHTSNIILHANRMWNWLWIMIICSKLYFRISLHYSSMSSMDTKSRASFFQMDLVSLKQDRKTTSCILINLSISKNSKFWFYLGLGFFLSINFTF